MIKSRSYYEKLAESADLHDNMLLTEDDQCPPDILDRYSDDMNYRIRNNVANNTNTSKETLLKMYINGERSINIFIIKNINCPLSILECASFNEDHNGFIGVVFTSKATPVNLKIAILDYFWLSY